MLSHEIEHSLQVLKVIFIFTLDGKVIYITLHSFMQVLFKYNAHNVLIGGTSIFKSERITV